MSARPVASEADENFDVILTALARCSAAFVLHHVPLHPAQPAAPSFAGGPPQCSMLPVRPVSHSESSGYCRERLQVTLENKVKEALTAGTHSTYLQRLCVVPCLSSTVLLHAVLQPAHMPGLAPLQLCMLPTRLCMLCDRLSGVQTHTQGSCAHKQGLPGQALILDLCFRAFAVKL